MYFTGRQQAYQGTRLDCQGYRRQGCRGVRWRRRTQSSVRRSPHGRTGQDEHHVRQRDGTDCVKRASICTFKMRSKEPFFIPWVSLSGYFVRTLCRSAVELIINWISCKDDARFQ